MNTSRLRRALVLGSAASLVALQLLVASAPAAFGGDTRLVFVGSGTTDGVLTSSTVSAGQTTSFRVVVRNDGSQTLNNVLVTVGLDGAPTVVEANPGLDVVPALPVAFPDRTDVAGTDVTIDYVGSGCTGGGTTGPLTCNVETLRKNGSFTITALVTTLGDDATTTEVNESLPATTLPVKAVAKVAENTNDNGANKDTFAAEGMITVTGFSCETVTAYRATGSKLVENCGVLDLRNDGQSQKLLLPANRTIVTLSENDDVPCPLDLLSFCLGAEVEADIPDDSPDDLLVWTLEYYVGSTSVQLNKIVVLHYNDLGELVSQIPNQKKFYCKSATQTECIYAPTITDDVLTIVVQTGGNGRTRV